MLFFFSSVYIYRGKYAHSKLVKKLSIMATIAFYASARPNTLTLICHLESVVYFWKLFIDLGTFWGKVLILLILVILVKMVKFFRFFTLRKIRRMVVKIAYFSIFEFFAFLRFSRKWLFWQKMRIFV